MTLSRDELKEAIGPLMAELQIEVSDEIRQRLADYAIALWDWNDKLNLTRHTTPEQFVQRDVLDSWELTRLIAPGESVLDFGTGGGVPGIVMKLLRPDLRMSVVDSVGKKAKAVTDIAQRLELDLEIGTGRGELMLEDERYDVVVTRAVGPLKDLLRMLGEHWLSIGRLLAVKGPKWVDERHEARERGLLKLLDLRKVAEYPMPGTESHSVILQLSPKRED